MGKAKFQSKTMKIGIYSPYLTMMGGGERYVLSIADVLARHHEVDLYADNNIKKESLDKFNIKLEQVRLLPAELLKGKNLFNRFNYLRQYDLFIYMTDGSLFFSGAKRNFLIIQSPLHIPKTALLNNLKITQWQIICYSRFMKTIIKEKLGNDVKVYDLPPCVDLPVKKDRLEKKENIILTVGRFFPYPHDKKHDVLIGVFKNGYKKYFSGWKLIIAGGLTEEGGKQILNKLQAKTKGIPAEIMVNLPAMRLKALYRKAKIYWHATGFGEDLVKYPQKAEHFGIAPLEAMAYGCVPLVFNAGGLQDIVSDGLGGYRWSTKEELAEKTGLLINDKELFEKQSQEAKLNAAGYSSEKFYDKIEKIISG